MAVNKSCYIFVSTNNTTTMTTYGGPQKTTRPYNRTAPTKYDYFTALQNAGIVYRIGTPINALKSRCEKEGIQVK